MFCFCAVVLLALTGEEVFRESDNGTFDVCAAASVDGDNKCPMEFTVTFLVIFTRKSG